MKRIIKTITLSLILFICFSSVNAQNVNLDFATERNLMSKNLSSTIEADGSVYINEEFSLIRIAQYKDQLYSARFNAFNNEMEVKVAGDKIVALDNSADLEVTFTKTNTVYRTVDYIKQSGNSKRGFLIVLFESENYTLYKEEKIKFYEEVKAASTYQMDKPAKFQREDDIYYIKKGDKTVYLSEKKRDFLKAFPKHSRALKSYMKKNKLNPKNEDELITLVKHLSTL